MEGSFSVAKSFHGDIADFLFYNISISLLNMKRYKNCEPLVLDDEPIYELTKNSKSLIKLSGSSYFTDFKLSSVCSKEHFHPMLFPIHRNMKDSELMCKTLHGSVILPNNEKENNKIYDLFSKYEGFCRTTWPGFFWLGIEGDNSKKRWISKRTNKELRFNKFVPGFEIVTEKLKCVSAGASANKYKWLGTPCDEFLCPVCNFTSWPHVHIRGLCRQSQIDKSLFVHGYEKDQPVIHGAYQSIIYWGGETWEIRSRQYKNIHGKMLSNKPGEFLIGVHHWEIEGDQCGLKDVSSKHKIRFSMIK